MDRAEYYRYLASREWATLKEAVRARSGGICERCKRAPHQQTHHVTYERVGLERLDDLLGICDRCHQYLSAKSEHDPASFIYIDVTQSVARCAACARSGNVFTVHIGRLSFSTCILCFGKVLLWAKELTEDDA